jgi:hypothetical protein
MNEFTSWANLATYGGALAMVLVLTQLTKGLPGISRIPTRVWSYALSLTVLLAATYFTGALTIETGALTIINASVVSLAANGGYDAAAQASQSGKDGQDG